MGLQAAVYLGHMPWALTKEEEEEEAQPCGLIFAEVVHSVGTNMYRISSFRGLSSQ
jgi:hypothetical protein